MSKDWQLALVRLAKQMRGEQPFGWELGVYVAVVVALIVLAGWFLS